MRTFGQKGINRLARALGLSASTCRAYETTRLPPMPVLVRMSRVSGVDLRWLLTGVFPGESPNDRLMVMPARYQPVIDRFAGHLGRRGGALRALAALVDLLEDAVDVERRIAGDSAPRRRAGARSSSSAIPVLGRTAAGVPHFWRGNSGQRDLLLHIARSPRAASSLDASLEGPLEGDDTAPPAAARLIQCSRPVRVGDVLVSEFLSAPLLRQASPGTFALRVDGDSMAPAIRHGDLVILSPDQPARPGRPAVVKLSRQVGVTCKLFRRQGSRIRLIPINESFPITTHRADHVVWALAVLYRVRIGHAGN